MKYSEVLLELSRPTTNQYTSFAEDLLSFHSWYKHLDRINGNRFVFFLDPEGVPRLNKCAGEHRPYNFKQSSEEYRSAYVHRYGCINYSVLNVWEQPPTYIEFRGERIIVPNEVLQRQSCILFPYCYSASSKYMAMPSLVELLLNGWAKTEEQLLHHENRPFIKAALEKWQQLKEGIGGSTAQTSDIQLFFRSLMLEEVKKVEKAVKAIFEFC